MSRVSEKRSRGLLGVFLILFALGGLAWGLGKENLAKIFHSMVSARTELLLLAIGLYFFEVVFWACRWKIALKITGYDISLGSLYIVSHAGMFFTNITPISKAGGEPFRAYFVNKRYGVPYSAGFASIIGEGILSIPPYLVLLLVGLALKMRTSSLFVTIGILGAAMCFFGGLIFLGYRFVAKNMGRGLILRIIQRLRKEDNKLEIARSLERFYGNARTVLRDRKRAFLISVMSFLLYLVNICRVWLILLALGVHSSFLAPLLAVTVPVIAGIVPLLPGGLVAVEATMTAVLVWCGLPLPLALSATLIERGISYVLATIVGALAASYLGLKKVSVSFDKLESDLHRAQQHPG
jgi:uncharacterized protein (TIRG00374 family)